MSDRGPGNAELGVAQLVGMGAEAAGTFGLRPAQGKPPHNLSMASTAMWGFPRYRRAARRIE